jgi:phosphomannomutase/phosphoglucomutase
LKQKISPSVFREYDIRGTAGDDISEDFAWCLGLAYSEFILDFDRVVDRAHPLVSVGEDCRLSSSAFAKALLLGLREGGVDTLHLGNCPTPASYFSLFHFKLALFLPQ